MTTFLFHGDFDCGRRTTIPSSLPVPHLHAPRAPFVRSIRFVLRCLSLRISLYSHDNGADALPSASECAIMHGSTFREREREIEAEKEEKEERGWRKMKKERSFSVDACVSSFVFPLFPFLLSFFSFFPHVFFFPQLALRTLHLPCAHTEVRRDLPTINNSEETSGNYYLEWSNAKEEISNGEISVNVVATRLAGAKTRRWLAKIKQTNAAICPVFCPRVNNYEI